MLSKRFINRSTTEDGFFTIPVTLDDGAWYIHFPESDPELEWIRDGQSAPGRIWIARIAAFFFGAMLAFCAGYCFNAPRWVYMSLWAGGFSGFASTFASALEARHYKKLALQLKWEQEWYASLKDAS